MNKPIISSHDHSHGSVKSYSIGFALSLLLTGAAYIIADRQLSDGWTLIYTLAALAVTQLFVQLYFFLHLGRESKPRWNFTAFCFAAMVVVIVVFGSLWIMQNLDYLHGNDATVDQNSRQIIKDEGYQP